MHDEWFSWFIDGVVWVCVKIGMGIGAGVQWLILRFFNPPMRDRIPTKAEQREQATTYRETEYRRLVNDFIQNFGYMTEDVIDRGELEAKMDAGVDPQTLREELRERINHVPAITLGHFLKTNVEMKLPYSLRDRHCYLIGKSGSGKTNLIRGMLLQDIFYGCGVGVLAPEQELLTDEILPYIPEDRIDDVVYINPADNKYPVAFNPLYLDAGESIDDKVDEFVTIFKRTVGETGFRMDKILSETLYALINYKGSTLDDIERFLSRTNPAFRDKVLQTSDERSRLFFEETYPTMDKNAATPVLTRLSAFTRRQNVRNILCQTGKSFNFRNAMDEGKILLFNLSDGILGQPASQLLGQIIISKLQLATMSRADTLKAKRHPFYLYLDEFQTFTGVSETSYSAILSRARKYKLSLCLAHQQTGQISQNLFKDILGNVHTLISFSIANDDARKISQEYTYEEMGRVRHLDSGEFVRLQTGNALVKIGRTIFPLKTVLLPTQPRPGKVQFIIERSQRNYGGGAEWEINIKPFDERKQLPSPGQEYFEPEPLDPGKLF